MKRRFFAWFPILAILLCGLCSCGNVSSSSITHAPSDPGYIPRVSSLVPSEESTATPAVVTTSFDSSTTFSSASPSSPSVPSHYADLPAPDFLCGQSFLYDAEQKCFLYISGNDRIIYPASTTKLLTILFARALLPLDMVVTPGDELNLVGPNSSLAYIKSHHQLTVEQLMEGMLLPSGNDAAYVLAAAGGRILNPGAPTARDEVDAFLMGMNEYARTIGLCGSHFTCPDGYDYPENYSTLEDMALIARLAYEDEIIRKYSNLPSDRVTYYSGHIMEWKNTNWCIDPYTSEYYIPEMNGLKTGSVSKDYYCFLGSVEIEGQSFIFGFFGEEKMTDRFLDSKTAVQWLKTYIVK